MQFWSRLSIRNKLIGAIGGSLIITIVLSTIFSNVFMRTEAINRITENELPHILSDLAAQIGLEIAIPMNIASSMANNTFVSDWVRAQEPESERENIRRYLEQVKQRYAAETSFLVSAKTGNYYTQDGLIRTLSQSRSEDSWFYGFLASGKPFTLDLDIDSSSGVFTLFINNLTMDKQAVTGIGLRVNQLAELIRDFRVGEQGAVYLIDATGGIRVHPNAKYIGSHDLERLGYQPDEVRALLNKEQLNVVKQPDKELVVATHYIPLLDWFLVAEIPNDEIYGGVQATTQKVILINILLALVLIAGAVLLAGRIAVPIVKTAAMLDAISRGEADLTKQLKVSSQDEIGMLAEAFNRFIEKMRQLMVQLNNTAHLVENSASRMSALSEQTKTDSVSQQQSVELVATATTQMGATVNEIANNASDTAESSSKAADDASQSYREVENTVSQITTLNDDILKASEVIERLAADIGQISSILTVISNISEQTNLLALNAAIEAARAGEQGRGFAVVADEVRTLASRTQDSTQEVNTMIATLKQGASDAVNAMAVGMERAEKAVAGAELAGSSISSITSSIQHISDMSTMVATATEEQSTVVDDLNRHITAINDISKRTADASIEAVQACDQLYASASELTALVERFRV